MPLRLHADGIEIPDDKPFKNDKLDRKEAITALTNVVGNINGPCVVAVDASWGMGKTTFLTMWATFLRCRSFPVLYFNAWETDFAQEPFVALSSELTAALEELLKDDSSSLGNLKEATGEVLSRLSSPLVRVAASAVPMIGNQLAKELDHKPSSFAEQTAEDYSSMKRAMFDFRSALDMVASSASKSQNDKPLIVFIDELDRCKPTYAIRLLETAQHFFTVRNVVFVLGLDREQLGHSIKAVYGNSFDSDGYLRRFFDIDYRLPNSSRDLFVTSSLRSLGILDILEKAPQGRLDIAVTVSLISALLSSQLYSLRDALQALHRLRLVLNSLPSDSDGMFLYTLSALLLLRSASPESYHRLITGVATDQEIVDTLLPMPAMQEYRSTKEGEMAVSILISSCILSRHVGNDVRSLSYVPMLEDLRKDVNVKVEDQNAMSSEQGDRYKWAKEIIRKVEFCTQKPDQWPDDPKTITDECGFRIAVDRLELFSEIDASGP